MLQFGTGIKASRLADLFKHNGDIPAAVLTPLLILKALVSFGNNSTMCTQRVHSVQTESIMLWLYSFAFCFVSLGSVLKLRVNAKQTIIVRFSPGPKEWTTSVNTPLIIALFFIFPLLFAK